MGRPWPVAFTLTPPWNVQVSDRKGDQAGQIFGREVQVLFADEEYWESEVHCFAVRVVRCSVQDRA
eukprot:399202-Pleurochrysis_carterae.AAC.1